MLKTLKGALAAALVMGLGATSALAQGQISGAGATFPAPVYAKWAEAYKAKTGVSLNYQAIGSGGGIKQIKAKTVRLRRHRQAAEARRAERRRPVSIPHRHRRRRPCGEPAGHRPQPAEAERRRAGLDLPRRHQALERPGHRRPEPRREAAWHADHRRAPLGRLGHELRVHLLPVAAVAGLGRQGRRERRRGVARGAGGQGQ